MTTPPCDSWDLTRHRLLRRRILRLMAGVLVLAPLLVVWIALSVGQLSVDKVASSSMEPTLQVGDVILTDANAPIDRYDVVAFDAPDGGDPYVKRVLGVPGDRIEVRHGLLYLNGREEYSTQVSQNRLNWPDERIRVPREALFMMGDNRNNSFDSLNFGSVPREHIRGRVMWIVWPPDRWGRPALLHDDAS